LIVENGEHGSSAAAPIARMVMDMYMKSKAGSHQTAGVAN
jgi:cell division protein FtsI/penicillin-binding protein 2